MSIKKEEESERNSIFERRGEGSLVPNVTPLPKVILYEVEKP